MARPIEYSPKFVKEAEKYLKSCKDSLQKLKVEENEINGAVKFKFVPKVKIPTIEGLALVLEINRDTVYEWESSYPEFSDIISKLRQKQAEALIAGGLSGQYNPLISKVLLTKHGYREGIENTGAEGGPQRLDVGMDEIINKIYGVNKQPKQPDATGQGGGDAAGSA